MIRVLASFLLAVAVASFPSVGARASAQTTAAPPPKQVPHVRILSPAEGAFVLGPTLLRAGVEPPDLASSVVFFVDGRQVCIAAAPRFECNWNAGSKIAEHQVRLVVNLVGGDRLVRTTRTTAVAFAETVDVDIVQVTATVVDDRGRYVTGLQRSAFQVFEDGQPQRMSHFYSEDGPLELVVAVDMSTSMRPAMSGLKKVVSDFLGAVPSRHHVTLLGFNDSVFTLASGTTDPVDRIRAADGLTSWGTTALYDALLRGVDTFDGQAGRKALIVFTDGDDSSSHVGIDEVEQRLRASDLTLYMIGQGQGLTSAPLKREMERLSRLTGGRAFFTDSIGELHDAFNELLDELSHQYVLAYQSTNGARDGRWRRIQVEVQGHPRVRAREGYRATAPPPERR